MQHAARGLRDHTLGEMARPVGHVGPLPRGEAADRGAVPALRAGQDDHITGQVAGRGEKDRWPRVPALLALAAWGGCPVSGR
jgi:hypothetical protein